MPPQYRAVPHTRNWIVLLAVLHSFTEESVSSAVIEELINSKALGDDLNQLYSSTTVLAILLRIPLESVNNFILPILKLGFTGLVFLSSTNN